MACRISGCPCGSTSHRVLSSWGCTKGLCEGASVSWASSLHPCQNAHHVAVRLQGQPISALKVNKLSSSKTQLPYEYYSLPYCTPDKIISSAENLGEVLRGDRIVNSKYEVWHSLMSLSRDWRRQCRLNMKLGVQLAMGVDEQCKVLCRISSLTEAQAEAFQVKIEEEYRVNMCASVLYHGLLKVGTHSLRSCPHSHKQHYLQDPGQSSCGHSNNAKSSGSQRSRRSRCQDL